MEVSFYLDVTSLIVGGVLGSILTLGVLFGVAVRKTMKAKKQEGPIFSSNLSRDKDGKFIHI